MSWVCHECGHAEQAKGLCPTHQLALTDADDDRLLGQRIGPYRLARLLGSGGMGRVYLGVHSEIGSRVAVKVLSRDATQDRDLVARFFAEARAVNVVRHEGIVNVLDLANLPDGRPYIVMEFLEGVPLSSILYAGTLLPLGSYARLIGEVCVALAAAHAAHVVHRDLKPDNIFVSPQGRIKVLDFGIAKLRPELSGRQDSTRSGALLGTPQYMAPEQALARPIDARTDLYSLGLVLYEGATGHRPFEATSLFELLRAQAEEEPPAPRSLRPEIPEGYEAVLLQSLAKDPERRFQSADAMASALAAATAELPEQAWAPLISEHMAANVFPRAHTDQPRSGTRYEVGQAATQFDRSTAPKPSRVPWIVALAALGIAAAAVTFTVVRGSTARSSVPTEEKAPATPKSKRAAPTITAIDRPADAGVARAAAPSDAASTEETSSPLDAGAGAARTRATSAGGARPGKPTRAVHKPKPAAKPRVAAARITPPKATKRISPPTRAGTAAGAAAPPMPVVPPAIPTNKRRLDPVRYAKRALAKARAKVPDAELVSISAVGVGADGKMDISSATNFVVSYTFNSPRAIEMLNSGDPMKASAAKCKITVSVIRGSARTWIQSGRCRKPLVRMPRCSMQSIVARINARGGTSPNMNLVYVAHLRSKRPMWLLSGHKTLTLYDDC